MKIGSDGTFLLLAWTLGIVGEAKAAGAVEHKFQGLNLDLPAAAPAKDSNWNKLKYYEQADKDSAKLRALLKNDPYRGLELEAPAADPGVEANVPGQFTYSFDPHPPASKLADAEEKVYQKLEELDKELKKPQEPPVEKKPIGPNAGPLAHSVPEMIRAFVESNRFYGWNEAVAAAKTQQAIPAVVHEDQTLVTGATVKLRLLEDVLIAGVLVPKDQFVYGLAALNGERLGVSINIMVFKTF